MGSTRNTQDIQSSLSKKGFVVDEGGNHTKLIFHHKKQNQAIMTVLSRGKKEYDNFLLGLMARELKLTKKQLLGLIDCPIDKKEYIKLLKQRRILK